MNQWSQNHEEQLYNLSVKYESVKSESWRTIIQLYIYNKSSFTNGNDSLMKTITFINEDTIRYKFYCHENGKWKANRCKNCLFSMPWTFFTIRRRELFYYFLVTSDLKWKWKIVKLENTENTFVLNYITTHWLWFFYHICQFVILKSFKQCKFREAKMNLFDRAKK